MEERIKIILLDNSNKNISETKIRKPNSYDKLLDKLEQKIKDFKENYVIFILSQNNNELIIDSDNQYKLVKDILYIRNINNIEYPQKSMFEVNYDKLSESNKVILDEKYNCFICSMKIKNEKPYFCYKCQKLYHNKCLKEWDKARKTMHKLLSCPNCRNELPLEKWNKKLDYEEDRKNMAVIMNKLNKVNNYTHRHSNKKLELFEK